jgi:hypothetical protein
MNAQLASNETVAARFKKTGGSAAGKRPAAEPIGFVKHALGEKRHFCQTNPSWRPPQMDQAQSRLIKANQSKSK